jgi:hypothetical protein
MIAPMLPGAEQLAELLAGKIDSVILDRMNYHYADWVYRQHGLEKYLRDGYFLDAVSILIKEFTNAGIPCRGPDV